MTNTPPRAPGDPYDGMLLWVVLVCGLLLAGFLWVWPHVPMALRFPYFLGAFVVYYSVAAGFAALSRAGDRRKARRSH